MKQMQARHEYKHSLNYGDYIILRDRLKMTMQRDSHADKNGEYRVRSLYFDTPGDKALREKIDGVDGREKFRIRRYIGADDYLVLEKKSKLHGLCYKESSPFTPGELVRLQGGIFEWMAADTRELVRELYAKIRYEGLRPKTIVDYIREPFICPAGNVRVTFDREIKTGLFSTDFLNDDLPIVKAGDEIVLLEVKYDQFIPDHIVQLLQLGSRRACACSKYALCRIYG
jgi:hypothetical protein